MTPPDLMRIYPSFQNHPISIDFMSNIAMKKVARYIIQQRNPGCSELAIELNVSAEIGIDFCKKFYIRYKDQCQVVYTDGEMTGFIYSESGPSTPTTREVILVSRTQSHAVKISRSTYLHSPPKTPPKLGSLDLSDLTVHDGESYSFEGVESL